MKEYLYEMIKPFCPKCGKPSKGLCTDCQSTKVEFTPPLIQVSEYNRVYVDGRWKPFNDIERVVYNTFRNQLRDIPFTIEPFEFEPVPKNKITITAHANIDGEEREYTGILSYRQCDFGQKRSTQYFEGILQLRKSKPQTIDFIEQELKKVERKGVFVTKTVETADGVDLYITDKNQLKLLAQKIHERFGGKISVNAQLFSHNHQESKHIYRINTLVELPTFTVGDVISFIHHGTKRHDDELIYLLVTRLGKIIHGINLIKGKHLAFEMKYAAEITLIPIHKTSVAAIYPEISVLHPESYQAENPLNPLNIKCQVNQKVDIVLTPKGIILIK